MTERATGLLWTLRILSALFLLAAGGIHLYLALNGVGGILGVLFILNFVAGLVLAIAVLALRGRLMRWAIVLGLLFMIATLGSLLLALTVGLFGISTEWDFTLVPQTVIVESIGVVVLAVTTLVAARRAREG